MVPEICGIHDSLVTVHVLHFAARGTVNKTLNEVIATYEAIIDSKFAPGAQFTICTWSTLSLSEILLESRLFYSMRFSAT